MLRRVGVIFYRIRCLFSGDLFLRGRREIDARREVVERVLAMGSRQVLVDGLEVFQGSNLTVEDVSSGLKAIFCLTVGNMLAYLY